MDIFFPLREFIGPAIVRSLPAFLFLLLVLGFHARGILKRGGEHADEHHHDQQAGWRPQLLSLALTASTLLVLMMGDEYLALQAITLMVTTLSVSLLVSVYAAWRVMMSQRIWLGYKLYLVPVF